MNPKKKLKKGIDILNKEQIENNYKEESQKEERDDIEISPNVLELSGIISLTKNLDSKDELRKHHMEK